MLNPKTMTAQDEAAARAQAFYLLKRFTSFTFLDKARELYQGFLDAFASQLHDPHYANYVGPYKAYMKHMIPIEEGLHLLRYTPHKLEAYRHFEDCTRPISRSLFGRDAHETGISYEPFFQSLGMAEEESGQPDVGVIRQVLEVLEIIVQTRLTIFDRTTTNLETWGVSMAYNYETVFAEPYFWAAPRYKQRYCKFLYPFNFPTPLPPCPPRNTCQEGQVWSGQEIPVTGIYEPWFIDGVHVGCPNYFLAGQEAIEYQMEGTQDKEMVAWRLIWEDKRYLDGCIPPEEAHYLREPEPDPALQVQTLSAKPGEPCPKAGRWFAPHLQMKEVDMKLGEPMPAEVHGSTGGVTWYFRG